MSRRIGVGTVRVECADGDPVCWSFRRSGRSLLQLLRAVQPFVWRAVASLILVQRSLRLTSSHACVYQSRKVIGVKGLISDCHRSNELSFA
jgi:hypothetical protein